MSPSLAGRAATHRGHEHRGSTSRGRGVPGVLGGQLPGTAPHQAQPAAPCRQPGPASQATSRSRTLNCVASGQNSAYFQPQGGGEALPTFADGSLGASFSLPVSSMAQEGQISTMTPDHGPCSPPGRHGESPALAETRQLQARCTDILSRDADQQQRSSPSDRYSFQNSPACFGDIKINRTEGTVKFHCSVMR